VLCDEFKLGICLHQRIQEVIRVSRLTSRQQLEGGQVDYVVANLTTHRITLESTSRQEISNPEMLARRHR
jgi:hypothetical protein